MKEMLLKEIQNKQKFPHADRHLLSPLSQEEWDHLSSLGELPWCGVHTCMFICMKSYGEIRTTLKVLPSACFEMGSFVDCCVFRLGGLSHMLPGILLPLPPILPKGIMRLHTILSFSEGSGDLNLGLKLTQQVLYPLSHFLTQFLTF